MYIRRLTWFVAAALVAASTVKEAAAQIPVTVSVATDGTPGNSNSFMADMSATGRFVTFMSFASNLVPNDTNGERDVFLRDRDTDADGVFDEPAAVATIRVSELHGLQANGASEAPAITPDGRYVVFTSFASNLFASGQPPLAVSVILRWDRTTGDIVLVSRTTAGDPLLAARSVDSDVSDDGNHIVFTYGGSLPSEVAAGFAGTIYHRDVGAGTLTEVINTQSGPEGAILHLETPSISGDGATLTYGAEITSGLQTMARFVYVVDVATNTIRAAYVGAQPGLSRDGALLAFIEGTGPLGPAVRIHLPSGERRRSIGLFSPNPAHVALSPSGRFLMCDSGLVDFEYASAFGTPIPFDDSVAFDAADLLIAHRRLGDVQVVVSNVARLQDSDNDGLNDYWKALFGLEPHDSSGINSPTADPDNDGLTNAEEFARGSHPRGTAARFLAEGATGTFFATRYAIANPNPSTATIAVRLNMDGGGVARRSVWIEPGRTVVVDSRAMNLGTASFSAVVESDVPVVVDRLMTWGEAQEIPYGSHAETSSPAPATSWLLAEGSTVLDFQLFYLLQNPQTTPATATVRYLLPSGAPVVRTYDLAPQSRTTIYVNTVPGLESTDVSAEITATQPIAVERAMYRSAPGQPFALGHAAAAVTAPATTWFFGEGSTGAFFDTYLLLANPSAQPATVQVEYLRDGAGAVTRTYSVPANRRFSIYVDGEPGMAATAFGTRVTSSVPIVAERAMYWPGGFFDYYEAHDSAGATQTGSHWVLAEGEEGGPNQAHTFVLIANTAPTPVSVRVRTLPETGPAETSELLQIAGNARLTFPLITFGSFLRGGVEVVEEGSSTGALVVEGSMYWNAAGRVFGAGANWPATRIP
jgi:hypothetical protein